MPVRVQCPECEKVLKAPDAARGKALKCPGCGGRVPVPAARRKKAARRPPSERPRKSAPPDHHDDVFGGLDLRYAEDRHTRICPKCAAEVDEEDIECPSCGINLETGKLSEKQRKMRERKGPDPAAFYGKAWSDPWEFLLGHWTLAIRSAVIWGLALTLVTVAAFTQVWVVGREFEHRKEVLAEEQQASSDTDVTPPTDQELMLKAQFSPPALFWGGMIWLGNLIFVGWYWFLAGKIISATMERKKQVTRVQVDWFANAALGIKGYVWPFVLILPFFFFPPIWLLPFVCLPIAMVHMTQKYTYKAYLPWDMLRIFCKTAAPCLYLLMMAIVLNLLALIAFIVLFVVMQQQAVKTFVDLHTDLYEWMNEITFGMDAGFFRFVLLEMPSYALLSAAVWIPFALLISFPAVFIMRANGLFGYYFRPELELENSKKPNVPCGFWPRWLAYLIDVAVIGFVLSVVATLLAIFGYVLFMFGLGATALILFQVYNFGSFVFQCVYFIGSESGIGQATVGKRALGIIVTTLDGERITKGTAASRYFSKILSAFPLLIGFFMAAFTEKKQAWHDQLSKTLVVWRGDDART